MTPHLSSDVRQAVEANHGCTEAEAEGSKFVVMSMDFYREMLGIDDKELAASLAAVAQARKERAEGNEGRPFREVLAELGTDEV